MRHAFAEQHKQRFGFASLKKDLIVEAIAVECVAESHMQPESDEPIGKTRTQKEIPSCKTVKVFTHNAFHQAPIYQRNELVPGDCIKDCAIICDAGATTIVEPGWQAEVTSKKHLILTR